jgi:2-polyprenyl-6-methoxyphenol hydroxylase-like FAD-dependent oxidoreductase
MKIAIIGAGPAGLYFARLRKLRHPDDEITVFDQNEAGQTFGFGVAIAHTAAERYLAVDPVLSQRITAASFPMPAQRFTVGAHSYRVASDVNGMSIERRALLQIMAAACSEIGIEIRAGRRIEQLDIADEVDLLVGADGANSLVLAKGEADFQPRCGDLNNRFAWFGVSRSLPESGLSFKKHGPWQLIAHYYPYTPTLSTFVAEVDGPSWAQGFSDLTDAQRKRLFEDTFAEELQGAQLIENRSIWRRFRHVHNAHWQAGKRVLLGDALSVAHFSIGSGTRLAMDDALALFDALEANGGDVASGLPAFEAARRPVRQKLMDAARNSWDWYEQIGEHVQLPLMDFIHSFMSRTGRMSPERLARAMPQFAADHAAWRAAHAGTMVPEGGR